MLGLYSRMLDRRPLLTRCVSNGVLVSIGDALCQTVIEAREFSLQRNLNFFCINFFVSAPVLHLWYSKLLPRIHAALFPRASQMAGAVYRVLLDQLCFTPVIYAGFYPILEMVRDRDVRSFGKGVERCREKLWETVTSSWKVWPLAIGINFYYVPVKYHVLFVNFIGVFWNVFFTYIASK